MTEIVSALEASIKDIDKVAVFVDGYYAFQAMRKIELQIDWLKFKELFKYLSRVTTINFYLSVDGNTDECKNLSEWLTHNGYKVIIRNGTSYEKEDYNKEKKENFLKQNYITGYDIELAIDMLNIAKTVDKVILFSANSEFSPLINAVQNLGTSVIVISNSLSELKRLKDNQQIRHVGNVSTSLIRECNEFYELNSLRHELSSGK